MKEPTIAYQGNHFNISQLGDGIYAAIHRAGGWAISNAGIIDLGECCLVYDTFLTARAAGELQEAILQVLSKPVRYIVNSHYHNDHTWGNQAFAEQIDILASLDTRELVLTEGKKEVAYYKANSAANLDENRKKLARALDDQASRTAELWIGYYEGLVECMPFLQVRLPTVTFHETLELHGGKRHVVLKNYKNGHTGSDTVLWVPDSGVLFMSDLLFVDCHPYLGECDPDSLLKILDKAAGMPCQAYIPGHGPAGTRDDVLKLQDYIRACQQQARELQEKQIPLEQVDTLPVPEAFRQWDYPFFYPVNIRYFSNCT